MQIPVKLKRALAIACALAAPGNRSLRVPRRYYVYCWQSRYQVPGVLEQLQADYYRRSTAYLRTKYMTAPGTVTVAKFEYYSASSCDAPATLGSKTLTFSDPGRHEEFNASAPYLRRQEYVLAL